ncbi:MAG: DUF2125 domain-containing protein [Stellaceae bacterium]
MRRSTRLALAGLLLLLVLFGLYAAYWRIAAARIADGIVAWQQSARARRIDASWRELHIGGFPFEFRVVLDNAELRDGRLRPAPELHLPVLTGTARVWGFADWRLAAPKGLAAGLAGAESRHPTPLLTAQTALGSASFAAQGGGWLWLRLKHVVAEAGARIPIADADAWITLPPAPPRTHTEPGFGLALDLRQLDLPGPPGILGATIDELAISAILEGTLPNGPLPQALAAWRDAGGTVELDHLRLRWGGVGVTASGTLALDQNLQPIAAFSGGIEGFRTILSALVAAGRLGTEEAALAQIALSALAKPGADGKPQIRTAFTIQDGKMFLGPVQLGDAPRIEWK